MRIVEALPSTCRGSASSGQLNGAHGGRLRDLLARRGNLPVAFARHGHVTEWVPVYVSPTAVPLRVRLGCTP
ncbi:hypothetical protein MKK69_20910, partial [Methylobacterium sp. J-026]|nr:hypothetical protein [Methylobacterium sp. J-026]